MTIKKFKEGEKIWQRVFPNRDPVEACVRMKARLERLGYFVEDGFDFKKNACFLVVNTGDNCLRFEP